MNRILASIVFTVYNQKGYVREALVSALSQSYEPLEIVVSDDGSTDGTRAVIDRVVADAGFVQVAKDSQSHCIRTFRKGDKTVVVNFNEKNRGICANFEYAFGLTHGELILLLAAMTFRLLIGLRRLSPCGWLAERNHRCLRAAAG